VHDLAIHRQRFHLAVAEVEDRAAGGLVDAAALHADEPVFDEVDPADAVFAAELVSGSASRCRG